MLNEHDPAHAQNDHHTLHDHGALPGMSYIYYPQSAVSVHTCCECIFLSFLSFLTAFLCNSNALELCSIATYIHFKLLL